MKSLSIDLMGTVQGVFFRAETVKKANELGLVGFVENKDDGSVHLQAEGEESLLEDLLAWCKEGPELAKVEKMDYSFEENLSGFKDFSIRT